MHAGKIATSSRLKATLAAITGGLRTTQGIADLTGSVAVHSDIAALRCAGIIVETQYIGRTETGRNVYAYYAPVSNPEITVGPRTGNDNIINPPLGDI